MYGDLRIMMMMKPDSKCFDIYHMGATMAVDHINELCGVNVS